MSSSNTSTNTNVNTPPNLETDMTYLSEVDITSTLSRLAPLDLAVRNYLASHPGVSINGTSNGTSNSTSNSTTTVSAIAAAATATPTTRRIPSPDRVLKHTLRSLQNYQRRLSALPVAPHLLLPPSTRSPTSPPSLTFSSSPTAQTRTSLGPTPHRTHAADRTYTDLVEEYIYRLTLSHESRRLEILFDSQVLCLVWQGSWAEREEIEKTLTKRREELREEFGVGIERVRERVRERAERFAKLVLERERGV